MLQASRDVCFRCFGEEEDHTNGGGLGQPSRVSRDHRITPGHERILQSDVCRLPPQLVPVCIRFFTFHD
jgi:hypothetical protein